MDALFTNQYVLATISLVLVLYSSMVAPPLPSFIEDLFESPFFRLLILYLIAYISTRDAQISLLVAVAFAATLNAISEQRYLKTRLN